MQAADSAGLQVILIRSARVDDQHWQEWVSTLPAKIADVPVQAGKRMHKPGKSDFRRLGRLLVESVRTCSRGDSLSLTALDDYLVSSVLCLPLLVLLRLRGVRILIYKYRVEDLFTRRWAFRPLVVRVLSTLILKGTGAELNIFDERFRRPGVNVLPDPWTGDFKPTEQRSSRMALGLPVDKPVVGLIGYQDERKGFSIAADALQELRSSGWSGHVLILGEVAREYEECLVSLSSAYEQSLLHETRFVSDKELPLYFRACDVIWLPYHPRFTASSGVLVRAAASGVPVVATEGGLIAYRVRKYKLGAVCRQNDAHDLAESTRILRKSLAGFDLSCAVRWAETCRSENTARAARLIYEPNA